MELFARCAWGFEDVLADELRELGLARVRPLKGGVSFGESLEDAYRACLWSRIATRVQLVLARVGATTADRLFEETVAFPWEHHLAEGATVAVRAHGTNPALRNTAFTALKVKDAACDRLREARGSRPDVDAARPDFEVDVAVHEQRATLFLNLSGESLHRRGYREDGVQTEAPLKETLAAGMVRAAGWDELAATGAGVFVDPMCGSGTLAIEAAMMAAWVAPGLLRTRWGFEGWTQHDAGLWRRLADEARASSTEPHDIHVIAGDVDSHAVEIARANAQRAGVGDLITFYVGDAATLGRRVRWLRKRGLAGILATNPPYGHRLATGAELPVAYEALSAAIESLPVGFEAAILTPDAGIDSHLGRLPFQTLACYNGPIEVAVRRYRTDEPPQRVEVASLGGRQRQVQVAEPASTQFAARLRKAARERLREARRAQASCCRVYDADLPEYGYAIDVFLPTREGENTVVRLAEAVRPRASARQRAARRLADASALTAAVLDVAWDDLVVVRRQDGTATEPRIVEVREGAYRFLANVAAERTGFAVERRGVRELVGSLAAGRRVAVLFSASSDLLVHAAGGGASVTVAVDASSRHLDGVRDLMRRNGHAGKAHRFACADVCAWLTAEQRAHRTYDLVLCAPPDWLPAKDAGDREWDVRRDLASLLAAVRGVLSPQGTVVLALPAGVVPSEVAGLAAEDASARVGSPCLLLSRQEKEKRHG